MAFLVRKGWRSAVLLPDGSWVDLESGILKTFRDKEGVWCLISLIILGVEHFDNWYQRNEDTDLSS